MPPIHTGAKGKNKEQTDEQPEPEETTDTEMDNKKAAAKKGIKYLQDGTPLKVCVFALYQLCISACIGATG